jgi:hypothetical protein
MIILQSKKLDDFFSEIIENSPVSAIEFFEDLSDHYGLERTWDIPDQWIWKFNNPEDLKDLLNDYDLDLSDL